MTMCLDFITESGRDSDFLEIVTKNNDLFKNIAIHNDS